MRLNLLCLKEKCEVKHTKNVPTHSPPRVAVFYGQILYCVVLSVPCAHGACESSRKEKMRPREKKIAEQSKEALRGCITCPYNRGYVIETKGPFLNQPVGKVKCGLFSGANYIRPTPASSYGDCERFKKYEGDPQERAERFKKFVLVRTSRS